ncbi:unnamed protein product, partial [marine sediment metagenome]
EYFEKYTPNFDEKDRYSFIVQRSKERAKNKYRMCNLGLGPFYVASSMRGFNKFLVDHYKNKIELKQLLEIITNIFIEQEKMWIKYGENPHGFVLYDDLGEQKGPFFSPKIFEEFYEPVYKRLIDTAHDLGCDFHLHCCNNCPFINFCHGDCQKHRFNLSNTSKALSILCKGWKKFYVNVLPQFQVLADQIKDNSEINSSFQIKIKKIGRNSLCPCKSGKKYKDCCLR